MKNYRKLFLNIVNNNNIKLQVVVTVIRAIVSEYHWRSKFYVLKLADLNASTQQRNGLEKYFFTSLPLV